MTISPKSLFFQVPISLISLLYTYPLPDLNLIYLLPLHKLVKFLHVILTHLFQVLFRKAVSRNLISSSIPVC